MTDTVVVTGGRGRSGRWICDHLAAENYVGRPTAALVEEQWGDLPAECKLDDDQSALSTAKAQGLLNWEPQHSWRDAVDADVAAPTLTGK
nr:hypothetical protein [Haloarcula quadrata]